MKSRGTQSYAFSKYTKTMWSSLFISLYFSWIIRSMNIGSVVDFPGRKPYCVLPIDVIRRSLASISRSHSFIEWHHISGIPCCSTWFMASTTYPMYCFDVVASFIFLGALIIRDGLCDKRYAYELQLAKLQWGYMKRHGNQACH